MSKECKLSCQKGAVKNPDESRLGTGCAPSPVPIARIAKIAKN